MSHLVGPLIMAVVVGACGWLCIFRTSMLVNWGRTNHAKSKLVQAYPFSSLVLKPWYPVYIRCAGIFIWVFDLAFLVLLFLSHRGQH